MKVLRRKLILSIIAALVIVMCLTSTTFAWFAKNREAWIDEFELEIEEYDGLYISVDGIKYKQKITSAELKRAIIAKKENKDYNDESLTVEHVNDEYSKIKFFDVTTSDLENFKEIDSTSQTDGFYNLKDASKYHYVNFDLYFMVEQYGNVSSEYELHFITDEVAPKFQANVPYMTSGEVNVKSITSFDVLDVINTGANINYSYGNNIKFDPANALRLAVVNKAENLNNVFEPNLGTSSYALDGGEGIYDPKANLAFQYLNAYAKYDLAPLKKTDNDAYDYEETIKDFNSDIALGTFSKNDNNEFNVIKLEFAVWIEGYDGDYIAGASLNPIKCYLSFYKKEKEGEVA